MIRHLFQVYKEDGTSQIRFLNNQQVVFHPTIRKIQILVLV